MNHVFISYSRRDLERVSPHVGALAAKGINVWFDQRSLPVSVPWLDEVRDAVQAAVLVVVFESDAWHQSENCASEARLAEMSDRAVIRVNADQPTNEVLGEIEATLRVLGPSVVDRTTLTVRARTWDRTGRSRSDLIGFLEARRLRKSVPFATGIERRFLAASRRRSARRTTLVAIGALITMVAGSLGYVLLQGEEAVFKRLGVNEDILGQAWTVVATAHLNTYAALEAAAQLPRDTEAAVVATALEAALHRQTPVDLIQMPEPAKQFAAPEVGPTMSVSFHSGATKELDPHLPETGWHDTLTSATPPSPGDGSGRVEVRSASGDRLLAVVNQPVRSARLSPDERRAALITDELVLVYDFDSGSVVLELAGSAESIIDVAWERDGGAIWGLTPQTAVRWILRDGRRIADDPNATFIFGALDGDSIWVATAEGELRRYGVSDGSLQETIPLGTTVYRAAASPDMAVMYAIGTGTDNVVVDVVNGSARLVPGLDCGVGGQFTVIDSSTALIPCEGSDLRLIELSSGETKASWSIPSGAASVTATNAGVAVGNMNGEVLDLDLASGTSSRIGQNTCREPIRAIAGGPGSVLVPVGSATGRISCSMVIRHDEVAYYSDDVATSMDVRAAAAGPDGEFFIIGYGSGLVVIHPTENLMPAVELRGTAGAIRSLVIDDVRNELIVVSRDGLIDAYNLPEAAPSNHALFEVIDQRLARARELGLWP